MGIFKDRRIYFVFGGALALICGLLLAWAMLAKPDGDDDSPPASQGGLVVQTGRDDDIKLDPARPLRCFAGGQFVGEMPVADCAKRNGVATGALDVGIDASGALAAANGVSAALTPLPPVEDKPPAKAADPSAGGAEDYTGVGVTQSTSGAQTCWRYAGAAWQRVAAGTTLNACLQALYAGQCVREGSAAYGRWGETTLRLAGGQVETSANNRDFGPLIQQGPNCSVPDIG
jgi:hypothetical protein